MGKFLAEYIWLDGQKPTAKLRSKTRIIDDPKNEITKRGYEEIKKIPTWDFDGSSTFQAKGQSSDCGLRPVYVLPDPIRGDDNILVLCEVMLPSGEPHPSNTRHKLVETLKGKEDQDAWFGIEQEYTLFDEFGDRPLSWPPSAGQPRPQGNYYCGVGCDEVHGRELVEQHTLDCMAAGIIIYGTNGEVFPGQWEFQLGPLPGLVLADQLWLARWLLYRRAEEFKMVAKLYPKPVKDGDWNGAGAHINFSTLRMREEGGWATIVAACENLGEFHQQHVMEHVYGEGNSYRLTGNHETAPIDKYRFGIADRGASVRIPAQVKEAQKGYLEDRRPAANIDPYRAFAALLMTICGNGFNPQIFKYFLEKE